MRRGSGERGAGMRSGGVERYPSRQCEETEDPSLTTCSSTRISVSSRARSIIMPNSSPNLHRIPDDETPPFVTASVPSAISLADRR
jgi:hypothetical protein